jgi:hypothetical protein
MIQTFPDTPEVRISGHLRRLSTGLQAAGRLDPFPLNEVDDSLSSSAYPACCLALMLSLS